MFSKRVSFLTGVFTLAVMFLIMRVFYLQIIAGPRLSKAASAQKIANSEIDKPRGDILDRNGIPFTDRTKRISVILKPDYLRGKDQEISQICRTLGLDFNKIKNEIKTQREPVVIDTSEEKEKQLQALNIQSISYINSLKRYDENSIARHILGYLNKSDQVGETGIEKSYEDVLRYNAENTVSVITDARNNILQGMGYRIVGPGADYNKLDVMLTLDYHIQKIVEDVMDRDNITGAVVVENVNNGDIIAAASKPDFDPNHVENYLESSGRELFNRAVASYNLGSIFKIVDVAQLFETRGFVNEAYFCEGSIKLGDKEFKCSSYDKGGHGWVGIREAFALSCNPYFINMGIKLGYKDIIGMAEKFGLGSFTGIKDQGVDESPGNLPVPGRNYTEGDVANIAIGQGDIMTTPLQIADMVATIANDGIKNKVNIVDSVVDRKGNKVKNIRKDEGIRVISKRTAEYIKSLMEEVTTSGTGSKANLEQYGGAGGKTGSAETGQFVNGEKVVHAWFAGYFPKRNPKYSITVFIENGKTGGQAAAPVFESIAEEIMKNSF